MKLLNFFLFDWISDYLNTPQYEMATQTELLGIIAGGIIALALIILCAIICKIVEWFK